MKTIFPGRSTLCFAGFILAIYAWHVGYPMPVKTTPPCADLLCVSEIPVTGIKMFPDSLWVTAGYKALLNTHVLPVNATNKHIHWQTENPDIAQVDAKGWLTAIRPGEVTIIATTAEGSFHASVAVCVKPLPTP